MNREKILEIAEFRGIEELICKGCGTVSAVFEATIIFQGPKVRAECPECATFIRWMPMHKAWRIFRSAAIGMVEIEKLDNGFLGWYLRTVEKIPEDLRAAINELIDRRTTDPAAFYVAPADVDTKKEIELIDRQEYLVREIERKRLDIKNVGKSVSPNWKYSKIVNVTKSLNAKKLNVSKLENELKVVEKKLKDLE